ncbi:anti-repressor SinI family protein [Halobacillus kuroshimensis]|nr:anti-repressor SinI family protein [Halobacillus kuroshimensis]
MREMPKDRLLDDEWIDLIQEAKALGLSKEEVENFLRGGTELYKLV